MHTVITGKQEKLLQEWPTLLLKLILIETIGFHSNFLRNSVLCDILTRFLSLKKILIIFEPTYLIVQIYNIF